MHIHGMPSQACNLRVHKANARGSQALTPAWPTAFKTNPNNLAMFRNYILLLKRNIKNEFPIYEKHTYMSNIIIFNN